MGTIPTEFDPRLLKKLSVQQFINGCADALLFYIFYLTSSFFFFIFRFASGGKKAIKLGPWVREMGSNVEGRKEEGGFLYSLFAKSFLVTTANYGPLMRSSAGSLAHPFWPGDAAA